MIAKTILGALAAAAFAAGLALPPLTSAAMAPAPAASAFSAAAATTDLPGDAVTIDLPRRSQRRSFSGAVVSTAAASFVLRQRNGTTPTIMVNNRTVYRDHGRAAAFTDLQPGMKVSLLAAVNGDTYTAAAVQLLQPAAASPSPAPKTGAATGKAATQHLGLVTQVSATSITVHGRADGKDHPATITAATQVMPQGVTIAAGDTVLAVYRRNPTGSGWLAGMIVRLAGP